MNQLLPLPAVVSWFVSIVFCALIALPLHPSSFFGFRLRIYHNARLSPSRLCPQAKVLISFSYIYKHFHAHDHTHSSNGRE